MNPFEQKSKPVGENIVDWKTLFSKPYNKNSVDPYTKLRIILANGAEFEQIAFGHRFLRRCDIDGLRRDITLIRREEQQQQKRISSLKPINETILETTIGYEHLAVDLTAALAKREKDKRVRQALDFALLEDFDHLYRYANLLDAERGIRAEKLIGKYAEIMPARPTVAEHRWPEDDVREYGNDKKATNTTKLCIGIITAAEQQTMNYYMNVGQFYDSEEGRRLYAEIAQIEEQHVTHYGGLADPGVSWLECLLMHEYTECYLYYSNFKTETDEKIKLLWEQLFEQELSHLHFAAELLKKYEKREAASVIPDAEFPQVLKLVPQKEYVRGVIERSVTLTCKRTGYIELEKLKDNDEYFKLQQTLNHDLKTVPSHLVIEDHIAKHGKDYRFEEGQNPIPSLRDRKQDNTNLARTK